MSGWAQPPPRRGAAPASVDSGAYLSWGSSLVRRLLIALGLVVIAGLAYRVFGQSGRPRVLWPVTGRALSPPVAGGRWVGWLEADDDACRLVIAPGGGGEQQAIVSGAGLSGLAIEGDDAFITRAEPGSDRVFGAALVKVALPSGRQTAIASLARGADQIISSGGWLVWRSRRGPALPGVAFVAAAAPVTVIQARRKEGGPVNIVDVVRGDDGAALTEFDLLGVIEGEVYWVQRDGSGSGLRTRVRRAPCEGGDAETVMEEPGKRQAALEGDLLVWTAPSLEAGAPDACASVKQLRIGESNPRAIADWLGPDARVLLSHGRAYAQDGNGLWRLGARSTDQRRLFSGPSGVTAVRAVGDREILAMWHQGGISIAERPLTWWARMKAAVKP